MIQELHALAKQSKGRAEELIVTLSNLMDQEYTPDDAKRNRDIVEYAQDVIKYARSAEFGSELHQLLWTTTPQFMKILQEWQNRWHRRYKYNMKPVNCRDCGNTWSSRARKVKGRIFCNPCGLAKARKNKKPKKLNATTDTPLNESDYLPPPDSHPRLDSSPRLDATKMIETPWNDDLSLHLGVEGGVAEDEDS
ncbi:MAG: hypothetical protein M1840_005639 [Geoglossum simile]|nr:MAG: hypothetical protein M1840_005639 [Geoglossum simile]